ncbi:MAG: SRPBCC family protein [Ignavibacteriaceae bacterium]
MSKNIFIAEPGKQEVYFTRTFDAPRELVYQAYTDPDMIPKWWGLKFFKTTVEIMDVWEGGMWRFVHTDPNGKKHAFHGFYHSIEPPEKLVYTFEFEDMPGCVFLETVTFEELDEKTKVTNKSVFQSVEDRDSMINAGMESAAAESMDSLEELLYVSSVEYSKY